MYRLCIDGRSFQAYQSQSFGYLSPPVTPEICIGYPSTPEIPESDYRESILNFVSDGSPRSTCGDEEKKELFLSLSIRHPTYRWHVPPCVHVKLSQTIGWSRPRWPAQSSPIRYGEAPRIEPAECRVVVAIQRWLFSHLTPDSLHFTPDIFTPHTCPTTIS